MVPAEPCTGSDRGCGPCRRLRAATTHREPPYRLAPAAELSGTTDNHGLSGPAERTRALSVYGPNGDVTVVA